MGVVLSNGFRRGRLATLAKSMYGLGGGDEGGGEGLETRSMISIGGIVKVREEGGVDDDVKTFIRAVETF